MTCTYILCTNCGKEYDSIEDVPLVEITEKNRGGFSKEWIGEKVRICKGCGMPEDIALLEMDCDD